MKKKFTLVTAGLFALLASIAAAEKSSTKSEPATPARESQPGSPAVTTSTTAAPAKTNADKEKRSSSKTEALPASSELAASEALEAANEEHIQESRTFLTVDTPPPPPRPETKPPSPASDLVWVPGHWIPVKGEWQWKRGEWGFPATPVSVWIEAKYDAKTKRWTAGYWQPDKLPSPEPTNTPKDQPPAQKFF